MALVELTEATEVDTVWMVFCPRQVFGFDEWWAIVLRDGPDQPWRAVYRFRYAQILSSAAYEMKARDTADEAHARMVEAMDFFVAQLVAHGARLVNRVAVHGNAQKFFELMKEQPGSRFYFDDFA